MDFSLNADGNRFSPAEEIQDERFDGVLAAELPFIVLADEERTPYYPLRRCQVSKEIPGVLSGIWERAKIVIKYSP
jgi:hypothetical protein